MEWTSFKVLNKELFITLVRQRIDNVYPNTFEELIRIIQDAKTKSTTEKRVKIRHPEWITFEILTNTKER